MVAFVTIGKEICGFVAGVDLGMFECLWAS
jgi:hypothetical protein